MRQPRLLPDVVEVSIDRKTLAEDKRKLQQLLTELCLNRRSPAGFNRQLYLHARAIDEVFQKVVCEPPVQSIDLVSGSRPSCLRARDYRAV